MVTTINILEFNQQLKQDDNEKYLTELSQVIEIGLNNKYQELYEKTDDYSWNLEDTIIKILDIFNYDKQGQVRYLAMGLILADAVFSTIKAYLINDKRPEKCFKLIKNFLNNQDIEKEIESLLLHDFKTKSEGCQALDEALDVFRNLLKIINGNRVKEALLEIIDNCLEGYAIFPGSQNRRELFNWWLLEVITASWNLEIPKHLYTINGKIDYYFSSNKESKGQGAKGKGNFTEVAQLTTTKNLRLKRHRF